MSKPKGDMTPQERYDKANCRGVYLKLNINTDADILARLESVENRQGYIKGLIRADIVRNVEHTTNE